MPVVCRDGWSLVIGEIAIVDMLFVLYLVKCVADIVYVLNFKLKVVEKK